MTPEELIRKIKAIVDTGPGSHVYHHVSRALIEYESTPKPWAPPWPMKIPAFHRDANTPGLVTVFKTGNPQFELHGNEVEAEAFIEAYRRCLKEDISYRESKSE